MILKTFFTFCLLTSLSLSAIAEPKIPEDCKTGGFFIGCQAYTFNRFTVFEAIEKTELAGGKVIEFYPGQSLSPAEPNVKWDHHASPETIQKVKDQLALHHLPRRQLRRRLHSQRRGWRPQNIRVRQNHGPALHHHRIR